MTDNNTPDDGPFGHDSSAARENLDTETKAFLDVARMEAEGYTDEKLQNKLGEWDAKRLERLEKSVRDAGGTGGDSQRTLILGCALGLAAAVAGVAIWANGALEQASTARGQLASEFGDKIALQANAVTAAETTMTQRVNAVEAAMDARLTEMAGNVAGKVTDAEGRSLRIATGKVCPSKVKWTPCKSGCGGYKPHSGNLVVDTSAAGFKTPPSYYVSIEGSGAWLADGLDAIYENKASSFKLYVRREDRGVLPREANGRSNWCVRWLGIGE